MLLGFQYSFYPVGLTFNSYQRENSVEQKYLYNGKELSEDELLDLLKMIQDPEIGGYTEMQLWGRYNQDVMMAEAEYAALSRRTGP